MDNTRELFDKHHSLKTPCYIFDLDSLENHVRAIRSRLGYGVTISYAMKANPFLIEPLMPLVDSFEVCSPGEYRICQRAGISNERIILSGVYKNPSDLEHIFEMDIQPTYTIESVEHLRIINSLSRAYHKEVSVLLRLSSGNQFGLDTDAIKSILENRMSYPQIKWEGIQLYSGTQKSNAKRLRSEMEHLVSFIELLRTTYELALPVLEYGPGLAVSYFDEDKAPVTLEMFADTLSDLRFTGNITLEMGRYLVAQCGTYYSKVVDVKNTFEKRYAILDGGIHHVNYYGQFLGMKKPKMNHIPITVDDSHKEPWDICGALCTVSDVLVKDYETQPIEIGDIFEFTHVGAYSITESIFLFLSRDLPQVAFLTNNEIKIVRESIPTDLLNSVR